MSAASIAASDPIAPIAIPMSARDSTGASLIPSPTKNKSAGTPVVYQHFKNRCAKPSDGISFRQIETVRAIHEQLIKHMEQRFTIESLSKQFLMNPTTLKTIFKSVYGTSIAAHMKEHRMEQAAKLLRETALSIAEIAGRVGYDSQSRFTAVFKEYSGKLPKDYRRN